MEEFPIPNTQMVVDCYANIYDYSSHSIVTSELIRIGDTVTRAKALIVNTYLIHGRYDLLKNIDKVYLITNPKGGKSYTINLSEFCRDEGLDYKRMHKALELGHTTKEGWHCQSLN
ncbi:hypothetical protein AB4342_01320 [Vibrio breoganii]